MTIKVSSLTGLSFGFLGYLRVLGLGLFRLVGKGFGLKGFRLVENVWV